jgi:hypothetical protein
MMKLKRLVVPVSIVGSLCSATGISVISIFGFGTKQRTVPAWVLVAAMIALIVAIVSIVLLRLRLSKEAALRYGRIIRGSRRSIESRKFAAGTLRTLRIFAGDLSWLVEDLGTYKDLVGSGVDIRILTDTPDATALAPGKGIGVRFREYPGGAGAPLKASISDAEEESECRALIVKRRTFRPGARSEGKYCYWMKEYHGSVEYAAIKAMMLLFDTYYEQGTEL